MNIQELIEIAERVEQNLKDAIAKNKLADYLTDTLGVERRQVLLSKGWETTSFRLTLTTGAPNTYLVVEPHTIRVEVYWGSCEYSKILRDIDAEEVFETLKELYEVE